MKILNPLCILWSLFGSIWSRPEEVIRETKSVIEQIQLSFTGQIKQNMKKPVFLVVCIPSSYPDKNFHDFRNFLQTLANIFRNITLFDHCFLIWKDNKQIQT
jgi:hypothetical protein